MKTKLFISFLTLVSAIFSVFYSNAQTNSNLQLISLGGGETKTSKFQISYSIGEPTIGLVEEANMMLGLGFQYMVSGTNNLDLNCIDNLIVNKTIEQEFYQANSMQSNATVPQGENITFHSQESITLTQGFEVNSNCSFTAAIKPCE